MSVSLFCEHTVKANLKGSADAEQETNNERLKC